MSFGQVSLRSHRGNASDQSGTFQPNRSSIRLHHTLVRISRGLGGGSTSLEHQGVTDFCLGLGGMNISHFCAFCVWKTNHIRGDGQPGYETHYFKSLFSISSSDMSCLGASGDVRNGTGMECPPSLAQLAEKRCEPTGGVRFRTAEQSKPG